MGFSIAAHRVACARTKNKLASVARLDIIDPNTPAMPLSEAHFGGFFCPEFVMTTFDKPAHTLTQHLELLRQRGLLILDEERAKHYLANISYYRFSAYTRPFYVPREPIHCFLPSTTFEDVLALYIFDRELRLLLLDAIERIEVALRAQMTNTLAEHHGAHGYTDPAVFDDRYDHPWLMGKLEKEVESRDVEPFVEQYRRKYGTAPKLPPVWMAMELLTFKEVSRLFGSLRHKQDTQRISQHFRWPDTVLRSWFRTLSDLRNLCAHHARVWNREFGSIPLIPRKPPKNWAQIPAGVMANPHDPLSGLAPQRRFYMQWVVIESLMRIVSPESEWSVRLLQLLDQHPKISRHHMGFPDGWEQQAFWQPVFNKFYALNPAQGAQL